MRLMLTTVLSLALNCSTIQMMVALEPVRQKWGLDRIIVSTYQAVSGAGMGAIL